MKFLIAILALASLCRADESHSLQAAKSANYGEVTATAQESSNPHDFQYDGNLHRVQRDASYGTGNYYQDGSGYHPFFMNQQYARQPEDNEYTRREKQQYGGYGSNRGSNDRLLHEFIHDSNFRAQLQAYAQAYYPHTKDTYGPGENYQSNLYNLYQKYISSTR